VPEFACVLSDYEPRGGNSGT